MKRIRLTPSRGAGLYSRPPLERMMRMHQKLKAGRYPNCRKLADELEVSAKTVQRDIDFMRYRLGLPIDYDQLHFGFFYTESVSSFPNIEISEGELIALYIGQKALAQYKGTSFEAPLSTRSARSQMDYETPFPLLGATWIQPFHSGVRDEPLLTFIYLNS